MTTEQFNGLPKNEKAILVAKDVIKQLNDNKYIANTGLYLRFEDEFEFEGDIKSNFDKLSQCQVCALGSMLLSSTNLGNILTTDDIDLSVGILDLQSSTNIQTLFDSIFTDKQLLLIETAFEGYSDWQEFNITNINEEKENFHYYEGNSRYANNEELTFEEAYNCTMFFRKYEHRERLIAICNNIIKNNGIFIP